MMTDDDGLTPRQAEILGLFLAAWAARRPMPTIHEIMDRFGFASSAGVACHLKALARKGWLDVGVGRKARSIRPTPKALARIAGAALVDLDAITDAQAIGLRDALDRFLAGRPAATVGAG